MTEPPVHRLPGPDITIKDKYPLPLMNSMFDTLHGAAIFTELDLRSASDKEMNGKLHSIHHFEYPVMPIGLTNPQPSFKLWYVLRDFVDRFVFVYPR